MPFGGGRTDGCTAREHVHPSTGAAGGRWTGGGSRRGTPGIHPLPPSYTRVRTSDISVSQAAPSPETAHSCRTTFADTGSSVIRT